MKVKFIGGAGTVTGSKTLIESNGIRILIDCGLFQGIKPLRELNWEPLPILPSTIDFVLLTHGHLDHCLSLIHIFFVISKIKSNPIVIFYSVRKQLAKVF